jgi:hypothetical protein
MAGRAQARHNGKRSGPHTTSTTQGMPRPRATHADTHTCWHGRACMRMCVQSECASAGRSRHHLTKMCARETGGAHDWYLQPQKRGQLYRDDLVPAVSPTLRVVRNCTTSNKSTHNTSANKGKESSTRTVVGSPTPANSNATTVDGRQGHSRDVGQTLQVQRACVRAKAPSTYLNAVGQAWKDAVASVAWAPGAPRQQNSWLVGVRVAIPTTEVTMRGWCSPQP